MEPKQARGKATRQHIVDTATQLFAERGYEAVSIEMVLRATGLSRGALYHHFPAKEALFHAVVVVAESQVAQAVAAAAQHAGSPLEALRAGCAAWLDLAARDRVVRQIILLDAPAVLGWEAWREIDARYALGMLKAALAGGMADDDARGKRSEMYAHILLAALVEAAQLIARSGNASTMAAAKGAVERVLLALAGPEA